MCQCKALPNESLVPLSRNGEVLVRGSGWQDVTGHRQTSEDVNTSTPPWPQWSWESTHLVSTQRQASSCQGALSRDKGSRLPGCCHFFSSSFLIQGLTLVLAIFLPEPHCALVLQAVLPQPVFKASCSQRHGSLWLFLLFGYIGSTDHISKDTQYPFQCHDLACQLLDITNITESFKTNLVLAGWPNG